MAFITTGLTNGGLTAHYLIKYDDSLSAADGVNRANALIPVCETDFNTMTNWFAGIALPYAIPYEVDINPGPAWSASWGSGPPITVTPGNGSPLDLVRFLLVSEVTEMFMLEQGLGWSPLASSEGSAGEGLSHFLATQLLIGIGSGLRPSNLSNTWLSSAREDFINNVDFVDNAPDPKSACAVLFLWYLNVQLGFNVNQIVAAGASELSQVYRNLTGDIGDPFPFFKYLMDSVFPGTSTIPAGTANMDNPFPVGLLAFWVDKSTFGKDEVQDVIASNGGVFPNAFWLVIEGFNINTFNSLNVGLTNFAGTFTAIPGISISQSATPIDFENPGLPGVPQRIRIAFDIKFTNASLTAFPATNDIEKTLSASISVGGNVLSGTTATTLFELVAGADPYFTNIDPTQNNVFYLSQDLRVFTATPAKNNMPVPGGPAFNNDSFAGAFNYVQQLIPWLNNNFSDPSGTDPFSSILPGQGNALSDDSSVTPYTIQSPSVFSNYNFAIARVRLKGTAGPPGAASNVKVFFRLWASQTADTDFQPSTTYLSNLVGGKPQSPQVGSGNTTIPFFATGNLSGFTDYDPGGINNRLVQINSGDSVWAYFGCFLNVYDLSNTIGGQPVQSLLAGTHHCIIAQIAFDGAPIVNAGGVTESPENSDKLAQRNLQVTHSDNPGLATTHRIPQTFDTRPSKAIASTPGALLNYPDELMIDWKNTPVGSVANIYWPQVNASDVLDLASRVYGTHELSAADAHTIQCKVTKGASYIPIPSAAGDNFAGLLTIDLPTTVVTGQEFNIVVRRISTRRNRVPMEPALKNHVATTKREVIPIEMAVAHIPQVMNWRYVTGTFHVKIPVTTKEVMLLPEENTLAIMKWRLKNMSPSSRWYPVLVRYISYISARIDGLGGNSDEIKPSPWGVPVGEKKCGHEKDCQCAKDKYKCISRLTIAVIAWLAFWILAIWAVVYFANAFSSRPQSWITVIIVLLVIGLVNARLIRRLWSDCK